MVVVWYHAVVMATMVAMVVGVGVSGYDGGNASGDGR